MEHPSRPILILVVVVATPMALLIASQVGATLKSGELKREDPLPSLTRSQHPAFFWGVIATGTLGAALLSCVIAIAGYWLVSA